VTRDGRIWNVAWGSVISWPLSSPSPYETLPPM
jgi:hypothetical protein